MATVKKIIYLTAEQQQLLKRLAAEEGLNEAEIVRRAIEAYGWARDRDPLLATIGIAQAGPVDGAVKHDRYLYSFVALVHAADQLHAEAAGGSGR